ncbi:MAG: 50S ribosome-binding GTPase [Candidatus Heimdallarchaeota archaeon]|nr:50S ribosome-binding GTPase [Candidatus Heimdallarchaeota archaeon]MCK5048499.1 50S ribosome-binding GTPase [Candidatus Heimdallarchaeota archaeon]
MDKYWSMVWKLVNQSDAILEVVDARFPSLCRTLSVESAVKDANKPLILVLNKSDLVPREVSTAWVEYLRTKEKILTVAVSSRFRLGTGILRRTITRSVKGNVIISVVGLPNTGKSSLINILKGRSSAPTAPIPGYTRALQLLRITKRIRVYDTPGVIPSKISNSLRLLLGVHNPHKLDDPEYDVEYLIQASEKVAPGAIAKHYDLSIDDPTLFLEELAKKRGRLMKGGKLNLRQAAIDMMTDHMNGAITSLYESPPSGFLTSKSTSEDLPSSDDST